MLKLKIEKLIEIVFLRIMKMKKVKSWLKKLIRCHFTAT